MRVCGRDPYFCGLALSWDWGVWALNQPSKAGPLFIQGIAVVRVGCGLLFVPGFGYCDLQILGGRREFVVMRTWPNSGESLDYSLLRLECWWMGTG